MGYYVSLWNIDFSMFGSGSRSGLATTRAASITDMRLLNRMNHVGAGENSEYIRMAAGIDKYKAKLFVILLPEQKPIWLNMTFPTFAVFTRKLVRAIPLRQFSFTLQDVQDFPQQPYVKPSLDTPSERTLELTSIDELIHDACGLSTKYLLQQIVRVLCVIDTSVL